DRGLKIVFVSDMYLPTSAVASMLRATGYGIHDGVYVSGDIGATKASGRLFEHVRDDLDVPGSEILHIGDDYRSDVRLAGRAGWRAPHLPGRVHPPPVRAGDAGALATSVSRAVISIDRSRREGASTADIQLWDRLGYEVVGPLLTGFAQWIERRAVA